jgi:DNA helicase-2/ATP-dependent DNA helicase PcrA
MTAHAAKGLEFKVVFVTGLEDGLFPSLRPGSIESEEALLLRLAEERRLAYVALTRARERLILSYAYCRRLYGGQPRIADPSRFVGEIPAELMERSRSEPSYGGSSSWSSGRSYAGPGRALPSSQFRAAPPPVVDDGELRVERDEASAFAPAASPAGPDDVAAAMFRSRRRPAAAPARGPQRIGDVLANLLGPRAPAGKPSGDGLHVEYDDSVSGFRVGLPVRHRQFGVGRVEAISPNHGGALLTVRFASGEKKTIKSSYLEPVADGDHSPEVQGD